MNRPITKAHLADPSGPIYRKLPEKSVNVVLNYKSIYSERTPDSKKHYFINIELNKSEK